MKARFLAVLMSMVLTIVLLATPAYAVTSKEVEGQLICQCGCTWVLDTCECDTAKQMRAKIAQLIDQGQNRDQIVAYFVGQYGEKVLAAPTKKGFNLVAWVTPFVAVAAGGTGLFFILRAWAHRGRAKNATDQGMPAQMVSAEDTEAYRGRLEDELKKFKEEGLGT